MNRTEISQHILEIVSDAGEGAQKAGSIFAGCTAKMGNYLWTVEIIPSEIQPPPHTTRGSSGIRIRFGTDLVTNGGNLTDLIFVFNEMSLLARIEAGSLSKDVIVLIDNHWANDKNPEIAGQYHQIIEGLQAQGGTVFELPLSEEVERFTEDPKKGKNMFVLGALAYIYQRDLEIMQEVAATTFQGKPQEILDINQTLIQGGYDWAAANLDFGFSLEASTHTDPMISMNGNQALAYGAIAAGFELCSMYPITPASSVSHTLATCFEEFGGIVHQAEDEIAAIGVAVGANFGGKAAFTVTSGPGMALKTEFMGLAVMTETPLVIIDVQRGGPSTGLPTKIEQGDLLSCIYGTPGDAPKVVMAASSIAECFSLMKTARMIAENLRMLVILLSDSNLATGVQLFKRPEVSEIHSSQPHAASEEDLPYHWDQITGVAPRLIPGVSKEVGMTSSLNHSQQGLVRYDASSNEQTHQMRSHKLATLRKSLKRPDVLGPETGDLLLVGWGSTKGAIEEAVSLAQGKGIQVSAMHLTFLNPLPPELTKIFLGFTKVVTVEINFQDLPGDPITDDEPRQSQLATLLRAHCLLPIESFARVWGRALMPKEILGEIERRTNPKEYTHGEEP